MEANPRCNDHKGAAVLPQLCRTCQRIDVERQIVEKTVDALIAAGFVLNVNNGGDGPELPAPVADRAAVLAALMETDEDYLIVWRPGAATRAGWVRFVYGNDGWDVICDYTTNLDPQIEPITEWADTLA